MSAPARRIRRRKNLFVVCAVDADIAGQVRSGRRRWPRARWDGSVCDALGRICGRVEVLSVGGGRFDDLVALRDAGAEVVFNLALSATELETAFVGCVQFAGLRCTGSGAGALALANDKIRSRTLLAAAGVRVPRFVVLERGAPARRLDLTPPVIVKPAHQASSYGIRRDSVVTTWRDALDRARRIWDRFDEPAVCDEFIRGRELRAGFIEGTSSFTTAGISEWSFPEAGDGFATESGRKSQRVRTHRATNLPARLRAEIAAVANTAFRALGVRGYGSLDLRVDSFGRITVLEVNANPGLSSDSPVWAAHGFDRTVGRIVDAAMRVP